MKLLHVVAEFDLMTNKMFIDLNTEHVFTGLTVQLCNSLHFSVQLAFQQCRLPSGVSHSDSSIEETQTRTGLLLQRLVGIVIHETYVT